MTRYRVSINKLDHRGHDIRYNEDKGLWECAEFDLAYEQLKGLKEAINRKLAAEGKAKVAGIRIGDSRWSGGPEKVTITSVLADGYCWIINEHGNRSRVRCEIVALDTPENWKLLKEYDALIKLITIAEKNAEKFLKAIPKVSRKMLSELKVAEAEKAA